MKQIITLICLAFFIVQAGDSKLKPLLIDVDGYSAKAASGETIDAMGMKMITATREYSGDKGKFTAIIAISPRMGGETKDKVIDTKKEYKEFGTIDGFKISRNHQKKKDKGAVVVVLNKGDKNNAILTITYKGIKMETAMKIAKSYDWAKLKAVVEKMM